MDIMKIFRWRSRVKTSSPSIAGSSIETLASHTADINAHPDYMKKGSAVPTGQEAQAIARHEINPICHADEYFRRGEGLRTREQYHAAKDTDYVPRRDKYMLGTPMPHLVTAYVLNMVLDQYITEFDIREMVKHPYMNAVGDGSQLIWIKTDGYAVLSDKTIGSSINPVYLKDGVITVSSETVGGLRKPVWLNEGTITAFTGTTGNTVTPVYISDGVFTVCSELAPRMCPNLQRKSPEAYTVNDVPTSTTPIKAKDPDTMIATKKYVDDMGEEVKVKGTVGSTCIPIWLDDGTFKTLEGPIGSSRQPIYMTVNNELMPMTDPIGSETQPIYANEDGELTASKPIPVSGCYIGTVDTDPATILGYGTWKMIAEIGSLGYIFARTA